MKKIDWKKLIFYIVITFAIGGLFSMFTDNSFFKDLNKPFEIPAIVFPIVWAILYLLMAISAYLVSEERNTEKEIAIYFVQLIVNSLWTLFFFGFRSYFFSFLWLILLIVLVLIMIYKFFKVRKISGIMNILYIIWLLFAGYLNYMIYYLN